MKNLYRIGCLLGAFFNLHLAQATPVDSLTVAKVAATYLLQHTPQYEGLTCVTKRTSAAGDALYYVFNHGTDKGFIIVTADDACLPVLGYATTGRYTLTNVPSQLGKLLFSRAAEISYIKREKLTATQEIREWWQELRYPAAAARRMQAQAVAPLLTTKWDQSPYYNDLCPANAKGQRVVTGCVATAMAQLMKYHNYPATGQGYRSYASKNYGQLTANFGNTTYAWSSMPSQLTGRNTAVATLMYHCGVSVNMDYGIIDSRGESSSAAYLIDATNALKNYFGYATTTRLVSRRDYAETAWITLLKTELDARRPVEYHGSGGEGGHSFVCDGYDNNSLFHFNWGWGGYFDGYFSVNNLNPGTGGVGAGDGNFNSSQGAIIGIQPPTTTTTTYNLQLSKALTINPNPLTFGDDVTVSFNLTNQGSGSFKGEYCVALFSSDNNFISFLGEIKTTSSDLLSGYTYNNDLSFTQKSLFISEGTYQIEAFYREPQKEWKSLGTTRFKNNVQVTAKGVDSPVKMYKTPLQASASPIAQNAPFTVNCNIANFGTSTFEGDLSMTLYNQDGSFAASVETKTGLSLQTNNTYNSPLVFNSTGVNIPVGTYLLAPTYRRKNTTDWFALAAYKDASGTYPNLIRVVVAAPTLIADRFEPNNAEAQAAVLPLSFASNAATASSESANLHLDTDLDYYKLDLPTGYAYELTARVHDSDNSGNGKTYTADVLFSYKVGSGAYSNVYDVSVNDINDKIKLGSGGTLLIKVGPYFAGETGTYLLDLQVTRQQLANITATAPRDGDKWLSTTTQAITWTDNISENVKIELLRGSANTLVQTITVSAPSSGLFVWTVPDGLPDAADYKIRISSVVTGTVQSVSGTFSIAKLILGIEDPTVTLGPNPTTSLFTIQAVAPLPYHTVLVLNSQGQPVLSLANQAQANRLTVDLSGQPAGVYLIKLLGKDAVKTHKISLIR